MASNRAHSSFCQSVFWWQKKTTKVASRNSSLMFIETKKLKADSAECCFILEDLADSSEQLERDVFSKLILKVSAKSNMSSSEDTN